MPNAIDKSTGSLYRTYPQINMVKEMEESVSPLMSPDPVDSSISANSPDSFAEAWSSSEEESGESSSNISESISDSSSDCSDDYSSGWSESERVVSKSSGMKQRKPACSIKRESLILSDGSESKHHSSPVRRRRRQQDETLLEEAVAALKEYCPNQCCSSIGLATVIVFWIAVQLFFYNSLFPNPNKQFVHQPYRFHRAHIEFNPDERKELEAHNRHESEAVLGSAALPEKRRKFKKFKPVSRKGKLHEGREALPEGCDYADWQKLNFPSCNSLHEVDLQVDFQMSRFGRKLPNMGDLDEYSDSATIDLEEFRNREYLQSNQSNGEGYISSGLWRNVWRIRTDKLDPQSKFAVIKMMKMEHPVDERNLDRHRRDALVMERLTHHPNVVKIYGYCGNTVMTEFVGRTLDEVLYPPNPYILQRQPTEAKSSGASRDTQTERVRLALDAAKGLAALHNDKEVLPGGIAHADIQTKQFIVDDSVSPPIVKINDFNRCRFVALNNTATDSTKACMFEIPSAPGSSRSPEEYNQDKLTVQLDVYSLGHIFFGILSGLEPFDAEKKGVRKNSMHIRDRVKNGLGPSIKHPMTGEPLFKSQGIGDDAIIYVMEQSYLVDPNERITAQGIVDYLEPVLQQLLDSQESK